MISFCEITYRQDTNRIQELAYQPVPAFQRQEAHHELPDALLLSSVTHLLKILYHCTVIHPCIPQCGFYILVTQYPLHTKNGHARIEQHRRAGMSELMWSDVKAALPAYLHLEWSAEVR